MGWTSYDATYYKKNGKVDVKKECDRLCTQTGKNGCPKMEVLRSCMIGSTYYAAVKTTKNDASYVWAAIFLTSTSKSDGFNFGYKDMDESCGPCECKCPKVILDLLSPTDYESSLDWRKRCRENITKKKDPKALQNLPVNAQISFSNPWDFSTGPKVGETVTLTRKLRGKVRKWIDEDGYRWKPSIIPSEYVVKEGLFS